MAQVKAPTDTKLRLYRIAGVVVWLVNTVGSSVVFYKYPWIAPWIAPLFALPIWYLGKLLGIPINDVLAAALARKSPAEVANIAVSAIMTMPVEQINPVALAVIESVRPAAFERLTTEIEPIPRPARVPVIPVDDLGTEDTAPTQNEK